MQYITTINFIVKRFYIK